MTEAEWLKSVDAEVMLGWLMREPHVSAGVGVMAAAGGINVFVTPSDRKLRLFAVAYSRLYGTHYRELAHVAAEHADATARAEAWADSGVRPCSRDYDPMWHMMDDDASRAAMAFAHHAMRHRCAAKGAALLREVIGNPFRSVLADCETVSDGRDCACWHHDAALVKVEERLWMCPMGRKWFDRHVRTPAVLSLALAAYEERSRPCPTCNGARHLYHVPTPRTLVRRVATDESIRPGPAPEKRDCNVCHGTGREDGTLDPARLAVLSDALEEAGCPIDTEYCPDPLVGGCGGLGRRHATGKNVPGAKPLFPGDTHGAVPCGLCGGSGRHSPLLSHLRSPGPHVRGCWALDLILGKE